MATRKSHYRRIKNTKTGNTRIVSVKSTTTKKPRKRK
jgi:hypothetical protein